MRAIYHRIKRLARMRFLLVVALFTVISLVIMWKRLSVVSRTFSQPSDFGLVIVADTQKRDKNAWMKHSRIKHTEPDIAAPQTDNENMDMENVIPKLMAIGEDVGAKSLLAVPVDYLSSKYLRKFVASVNHKQTIHNTELFPNRPTNGPVVVVQVHKRVEYFINLLKSLRGASGVRDILLVISHDYISDALNAAVRSIDFCQFMQIFFPHSPQLYPTEYPGSDPNDCPRDATRDKAETLHCNNAEHPDMYGHYREAAYSMTKLHWWWKANMVFGNLNATRDYDGPVVMLEEDHHVAPDFFDVLFKLDAMKKSASVCEGMCDLLSLGTYTKVRDYEQAADTVAMTTWRSYQHNMAMTIYRATWETIKKCGKDFCTYDDYNWDWSLMQMSLHCHTRPLSVLGIVLPRVFHVGGCGMHHKEDCDVEGTVSKLQSFLDSNREFFFQKSLSLVSVQAGEAHVIPPNGGWGDTRDHELCRSFMYDKLTQR